MASLSRQEKGYYLQENQGWELGFIHSWQSAGHGNGLVGFPHSTVRYWDLRYFFDSRSYERVGKYNLPLPDFVAMNGEMAKKMYLDAGYRKDKLLEVEALRYLHLADADYCESDSKSSEIKERTVLVLGDYVKENTVRQMHLLQDADCFINDKIKYIVKPHPACPISEGDYPRLQMVVTNEPISRLLKKCSFVYTSNVTSAAVDAYCAGKRVITFLDPNILNLSPLRGSKGVDFVSSSKELASILNGVPSHEKTDSQGRDYFYVDVGLQKWKKILSMKAL